MTRHLTLLTLALLLGSAPSAAMNHGASDSSPEDVMAALKGAAPANLVAQATIMNGQMIVQEGTNGWTCMVGGGVPMCVDRAGLQWIHALKEKGPMPQDIGMIYMLKGDAGASNTDPYATAETPDNNWVKTGPHLMVVGPVQGIAQTFPRDAKPDITQPYVMWPGTPFEHLMLPVE